MSFDEQFSGDECAACREYEQERIRQAQQIERLRREIRLSKSVAKNCKAAVKCEEAEAEKYKRELDSVRAAARSEIGNLQAIVASLQDILEGNAKPIEDVIALHVVREPRSDLLAEARAAQCNPMILDDGLDTRVCDCGELIGRLADEIERLLSGLKPFAFRANQLPINNRPDDQMWYSIEMRHWREAVRLINS